MNARNGRRHGEHPGDNTENDPLDEFRQQVDRAARGLTGPYGLTASPPEERLHHLRGDVVTLDKAGTVAEAVRVRIGRTEAVGSREEVMRQRGGETELIDVSGGAVLPGFIDPALHLDVMVVTSLVTDLNPCLPQPYEMRKRCPLTIFDGLAVLKQNPKPAGAAWLVAGGLDRSLMTSTRRSVEPLPRRSSTRVPAAPPLRRKPTAA